MTRLRSWDEECSGADHDVELIGGSWASMDGPGAPDGEYDSRITLSAGTNIALEVAQDTTEEVRRQYAIEEQLDWSLIAS